ncbi:neuroblast differentiation-associated protein AHNAK-like isoform X2 [Epinephelus moara]|uniref:neuroblast differentiation-associated protein AHNAK-like isoform X2 n=1 Tax=Epinephelus moara TaxID=300413 RepID=UPI00214EC32F|nr:neuroblast differentiation-associated protein AHNAK-like isoform X2 [Epinephelus moara]
MEGRSGGKFKMPHMKMPNIDISLPKGKIEGPEVEIEGGTGGKFKMPHMKMPDVDISLPKGKIEGPNVEIEGGTGGKFKMPHMKMPDIDISLPKGKIESPDVDISLSKGEIEGPEVELKGEGGKFKMPQMKMPDVDISLPKGKIEGPDVDISLPKGKIGGPEAEIEGSRGGKFKMPHMKMPNVDISLPKGKIEGQEVELKGEGGKFTMPHLSMPSVDISLPKPRFEGPDVEMEGGTEGKLKMPHWKMPDFDISLPKGKLEGPEVEIEAGSGEKYKMPHIKMPHVDISLPEGKSGIIEGAEFEIEGSKPKIPHMTMPSIDISLPKGKIEGPAVEIKGEGGKFKMPKVDISLPKGKPLIEGQEVEIKGDRGQFKMPNVGISIPKGKTTVEAGGKIKVPQEEADVHVEGERKGPKLKMPTTDIKGPKGDLELDIGLHRGDGKKNRQKVELPDLDLNTAGTSSKVKGPKVKGTKFKIGMPKKKTGIDVTAEAKICKNCGDEELGGQDKHRCKGKERFEYKVEVETHDRHRENKDRINIPVSEVTLPSVGLKTKQSSAELGTGGESGLSSSGAEIKVPKIPDIEFDIGTSQNEDEDRTEKGKKIKIPKFGVPLPSISSPEGRVDIYGPEIQYEGPKMPKVKKAVFVLVNPPQTDEATACTGLPEEETTYMAEKEDVKMKMPKIKMKPSFGKSKDKSAAVITESELEGEQTGGKTKMPKVSFSPGKSGSFDVTLKGEGSSSSLNGEKDASLHKGSKDDKGTFSGKIKLPKVELTSPYGKMEDTGLSVKLGKDSSPGEAEGDTKGFKKSGKMAATGVSEEFSKDVVSSHARTDMLDRDSSESPASFTMEFSSAKVQAWREVDSQSRESEERESSSWFKVPKFSLKPHSTD